MRGVESVYGSPSMPHPLICKALSQLPVEKFCYIDKVAHADTP